MVGKILPWLQKRVPYLLLFFKELRLVFRKADYGPKVFCIGYLKTGTTSVGKAMQSLGFKNSTYNKKLWRKSFPNKDYQTIFKYTAKYDSFDDLPWCKEELIPVLDEKFEGSKFVYMTRDEEGWKNSMKNWTLKNTGEVPDLEKAWQDYLTHRKFVLDYFKDRPKDILILSIKDPMGLKKLGEFLGKTVPRDGFAHYNKT